MVPAAPVVMNDCTSSDIKLDQLNPPQRMQQLATSRCSRQENFPSFTAKMPREDGSEVPSQIAGLRKAFTSPCQRLKVTRSFKMKLVPSIRIIVIRAAAKTTAFLFSGRCHSCQNGTKERRRWKTDPILSFLNLCSNVFFPGVFHVS